MKIKNAFFSLIFGFTSYVQSLETWIPIFSSSGGSAHEVTAQILKEDFETQGIPTSVINVTRSYCTFSPRIGKFFTDIWDKAQFTGNVDRQIFLLKFQKTFDSLFYLSSYHFVRQVLHNNTNLPNSVVLTSPLFLHAITNAVCQTNVENPADPISHIDLYMVESPSEEATYYYRPLKELSQEKRALIRLFTLPPARGEVSTPYEEEQFWLEKTGLSKQAGQIIYDPPLGKAFRNSEKLPSPGEAVHISLKGQSEEEKDFLKSLCHVQNGEQFLFSIDPNDTVGLIMLGSIPSERAILSYIDALIETPVREGKGGYLFISCGTPHMGLYSKVIQKIAAHNTAVKIIPFTAQKIEKIFARSNFSVTRSGGMTTQEILALKTNPLRNDSKTIYIHAEISPSVVVDNEDELIEQGIPLWEGGNARYLKKMIDKINIVTPTNITPYLESFYTGR